MTAHRSLSLCWGSLENASLEELIRCAAQAGFDAITVSPGAYTRAIAAGHSDASINALLAEHALVVSGVDPVLSWVQGAPVLEGDSDFAIATQMPVEEYARIASALHCPLLNAPPGLADATLEQFTESFAATCESVAGYGLKVALEFLPFSLINDLATAARLVDAAGCDNGGIMLDAWHFYQSGSQLSQLEEVAIDRIFAVQLNGVLKCKPEELIDHSMNNRVQAFEGDYDIAALIATLQQQGYQGAFDVEVFSKSLRELPPIEAAQFCFAGTLPVFENLGGHHR